MREMQYSVQHEFSKQRGDRLPILYGIAEDRNRDHGYSELFDSLIRSVYSDIRFPFQEKKRSRYIQIYRFSNKRDHLSDCRKFASSLCCGDRGWFVDLQAGRGKAFDFSHKQYGYFFFRNADKTDISCDLRAYDIIVHHRIFGIAFKLCEKNSSS